MAWILRNSGNEEHDGRMERVAAPKNTDVYLEAVETTENKSKEFETTRHAWLASISERKHSKRLLGCCRQWDFTKHHNKQKTCTPGILWYIRGIQVFALTMIEPPCTEPYARWCERSGLFSPSYSIEIIYVILPSFRTKLKSHPYPYWSDWYLSSTKLYGLHSDGEEGSLS